MSVLSRVKEWLVGDVLTAADLNAEIDNILNDYNGGITNANISNSAGISSSKIDLTFPSGAIVGTTDEQTLTNKTLTKPTVQGSVPAVTTDADTATITFNMAASNIHAVTLGGNRTLAVSNVSVGQCFMIELIQGTGGSKTVTWFSTIKWAGGSAPTLTTTAGKKDTFGFRCTASGQYDGYIVGQNI